MEGGKDGGKSERAKKEKEVRELLRCSWHRLAWLAGFEMTPSLFPVLSSSSPSIFHSPFEIRLPSLPFLCFLSFRPGSLPS